MVTVSRGSYQSWSVEWYACLTNICLYIQLHVHKNVCIQYIGQSKTMDKHIQSLITAIYFIAQFSRESQTGVFSFLEKVKQESLVFIFL